jgi:hypothetical protein
LNADFKPIYSSNAVPMSPPITTIDGSLYFVVTKDEVPASSIVGALYRVDVSNADAQPPLGFQSVPVVPFASILPGGAASAMAASGGPGGTEIVVPIGANGASCIVKYSTLTASYVASATLSDSFPTSPAIDGFGNVYAVGKSNTLYSFNSKLEVAHQGPLANPVAGSPVAANGFIYVAFSEGFLAVYDGNLHRVGTARFIYPGKGPPTLLGSPVVHGDKISVLGQVGTTYVLFTCDPSGKIVGLAPLPGTTQPLVQNFAANESSLNVVCNGNTLYRLDFAVPSASLSVGDVHISYTYDPSSQTGQFNLDGTGIPSKTASVLRTRGDWFLFIIGSTLYFYADGEQLFAEPLPQVPTGDLMISAAPESVLGCQDMVLVFDPTLSTQYLDGAGKTRQSQILAELSPNERIPS